MSIINETLNRLEMDSPVPAGNIDKTSSPRPAGKSMSFTVKVLATAMLVVFAGTSLMVWYWNDRLGGSTGLSLANAGSQTVAGGRSDHQPSPVPIGEQTSPKSQSAVQNDVYGPVAANATAWEIASKLKPQGISVHQMMMALLHANPHAFVNNNINRLKRGAMLRLPGIAEMEALDHQESETTTRLDQPAVLSVPRPAEVASEIGKQPVKEKGSSLQAQSGEKTLAETNVKPGMVKVQTAKSKSALAVPDKQQRIAQVVPSGNTAQPSTVDEAVERGRLALARGQYQQALAALETLSPVPERRVDFWLIKGSAHLGLGQLDPAEQALASAQSLAPGNAQIVVQRAVIKQEKGDHASALQILKAAATRHPNVPEVFLNQGYSQQELGAVRDARRSFRVFLRMTEGRSLYAEQRKAVNEWLAQFYSTSD